MRIHHAKIISLVAVAGLTLSACGGDPNEQATQGPTPEVTTSAPAGGGEETDSGETASETASESESGEETSEPEETASETEQESTAPSGDFPFEEGSVDVDQFVEKLAAAQETIKTVTMERSAMGNDAPMVMRIDSTNKDNVKAYLTTEIGGKKHEAVFVGDNAYSRVEGERWKKEDAQGLPSDVVDEFSSPEALRRMLESVELVDKAQRRFAVVLRGGQGTQNLEGTWTVDEQFRMVKQEVPKIELTVDFSGFNEPVEIPDVTAS